MGVFDRIGETMVNLIKNRHLAVIFLVLVSLGGCLNSNENPNARNEMLKLVPLGADSAYYYNIAELIKNPVEKNNIKERWGIIYDLLGENIEYLSTATYYSTYNPSTDTTTFGETLAVMKYSKDIPKNDFFKDYGEYKGIKIYQLDSSYVADIDDQNYRFLASDLDLLKKAIALSQDETKSDSIFYEHYALIEKVPDKFKKFVFETYVNTPEVKYVVFGLNSNSMHLVYECQDEQSAKIYKDQHSEVFQEGKTWIEGKYIIQVYRRE